jgi:hypothetical protein
MLLQRIVSSMAVLFACGGCFTSGPVAERSSLEDERPYIMGGKKDAGNIYLSTVMVSADGRGDELWLFYSADGVLMSGESDLAAIHLSKEVGGIQAVALAKDEVKIGSTVLMAGFGYTRLSGQGDLEERYFGTNEVAEVTGEIFRVTKQGTHTYHGDSGGPCLRWPKGTKTPVLVGITRGGVAPLYSTFTSTVAAKNREWLEKVLREAKTPSSVESP